MKDQITSIEQSKRLLELGVPAEKASMAWVPNYKFDDQTRQFISTGACDLCIKRRVYDVLGEDVIPAFTVVDLVDMMPTYIWIDKTTLDCLYPHIPKFGFTKFEFHIWKGEDGLFMAGYIPTELDKSYCVGEGGDRLVDILYGRIEWLLTKGFKIIH